MVQHGTISWRLAFFALGIFYITGVCSEESGESKSLQEKYKAYQKTVIQKVPRDAFPVLTKPKMVTVKEMEASGHINDSYPILGISINNEQRAYPISKLGFHELVNDTIGKTPIVVSW